VEMSTGSTLIQCDFDGTVTEEDLSFFLLDSYAQGDWREVLQEYKQHKISVDEFNTKAFSMVKVDRSTLLEALGEKVKVRAGFRELVDYCPKKGLRLVIVSNGLDFYIRSVLQGLGIEKLEVYAAQALFNAKGMKVRYIGPDGKRLRDGFKEAHVKSFLKLGYRVIYVGNGDSDFAPARYAEYVFATGELLAYCRENGLNYRPFENFVDVVAVLKQGSRF
jgi:2-hydroxy-3-keto-5-methylthiopentenyl-1-phosphate phosphatase